MVSRREGPARPWPLYLLAALAAGVIAFAITQIGPPTSSARTSREVVTAQEGVVQSTVAGTGNVEAGTDVNVNFQASGTISNVYVHLGQHVIEGQLMATLDPTAAQLTVDQAQEQLNAAQDQLTALENGTSASGSATGAGASGATGTANSASTTVTATPVFVSATVTKPLTSPKRTTSPGASGRTGSGSHAGSGSATPTSTTPTRTTASRSAGTSTTRSSTTSTPSSGATKTTTTSTTTTPSPASLASAQASIDSAEANLRSAEQALAKTKLYAPATGTIVSLSSLTTGDSVSAGSSAAATSSSTSSSGSSGGGTGSGATSTAGGLGSSGSSTTPSAASSGSSSAFAEIVDAGTMTMAVSFSESDITKVHVGEPATVSIDALSGVELAAHVSSIATVGTTTSSVVSYSATLTLDQLDPRVKPGMSASATVITGQAQGVTVPTQALTGTGSLASVEVVNGSRTSTQQVVVGLRGTTRAAIISGLSAGQQVAIAITLPSLSSTATSSGAGTGIGRFGGGGLGGLGGGGLGAGGGLGGGLRGGG